MAALCRAAATPANAEFGSTCCETEIQFESMKTSNLQSLKRFLLCLPLLGVAPTGCFLANYLDGRGILSENLGFVIGAVFFFIIPWGVAAVFAGIVKLNHSLRIFVFVATLALQGIFILTLIPPGATAEMMGIADRLRHEFSANQLRDCAQELRQRYHTSTLQIQPRAKDDQFDVGQSAVVVGDKELPASLRGRFQRVFIQTNSLTGPDIEQVVFALGHDNGIVCDDRMVVHEFFTYTIEDGVHAYRYQRM